MSFVLLLEGFSSVRTCNVAYGVHANIIAINARQKAFCGFCFFLKCFVVYRRHLVLNRQQEAPHYSFVMNFTKMLKKATQTNRPYLPLF